MRIYELGKELNIDSKAIIGFLEGKGYKGLTSANSVPDAMVTALKEHFAPAAKGARKNDVPKAAPLPDYIVKKVEAEARAAEEKEAKAHQEAPKSEEKAKAAPMQKKKKIIAVFNPQHAQSDRGRAIPRTRDDKMNSHDAGRRPAPPQRIPARDRVPDDERKAVQRPLPSQVRPARDRIPDDERMEQAQKLAREQEEAKARQEQEKAKAAAQEAEKVEAVAPAKSEEVTPEPVRTAEPKEEIKPVEQVPPVPGSVEEPHPEVKPAPEKKPAPAQGQDKTRESEAVKSLREKLVKGTVSFEDLKVKKKTPQGQGGKKEGERPQQGRKQGDKPPFNKNKNQNQGQPRPDRQAGPGQGRDNKDRKRNDSQTAAPVMNGDPRGKGKGGRGQKGRFEKQGGDKFDRFENEKGLVKKQQEVKPKKEEEIKVITIPDAISVKELAEKLKMQPAALIKKLFLAGNPVNVNDILDYDTAEEIAIDMDVICEHEEVIDRIEQATRDSDEQIKEDEEKAVKRPPVVCVMGHVDHGKTSLLDAIRNTNVIAREAGGITQHIGAYQVTLPSGEKITFLDTPGHEAFTAMRLRGAMATDVAILVVAADDGVMPQTIEAINHAKAAGIHVIVAVNKIDKPGANIDKVKQELSDQGLVPEDWGGQTIFCPVSAKKSIGIEELLEMVILDTEILELKANPDRKARGLVIEAKLDKGRGSVATLLVQKGTLKVGDYVAMGESYGRIRSMTTADGGKVKEAGPSVPVEITGMNGVPNAGDIFIAYDNDKEAKALAQIFIEENKKKLMVGTKAKMNLEDVFDQMKAGERKDLDIIIKADVKGSLGALQESLEKLSNEEVNVRVIHAGVGNVNESDATLASASNAIIIAFNVTADAVASSVIEREKVDLRKYNVIYNAIDDVELAIKGMLKPVYEEVILGHAEIRQIFKSSSTGTIAGSYITDGVLKRDSKIRLTRNGEQIYEGGIATLKRFSDDVKEVRAGYECGITLKDYQEFREGDLMEAYEMKEVPRR